MSRSAQSVRYMAPSIKTVTTSPQSCVPCPRSRRWTRQGGARPSKVLLHLVPLTRASHAEEHLAVAVHNYLYLPRCQGIDQAVNDEIIRRIGQGFNGGDFPFDRLEGVLEGLQALLQPLPEGFS